MPQLEAPKDDLPLLHAGGRHTVIADQSADLNGVLVGLLGLPNDLNVGPLVPGGGGAGDGSGLGGIHLWLLNYIPQAPYRLPQIHPISYLREGLQ